MSDIYVGSLFSDSYLEHHGILGMKWGIRRFQNKDGSLTSAGKSRYGVRGEKRTKTEKDDKRKGLSKSQKVAIALVAAGLSAYGGYKLGQSGALDRFINAGKRAGSDILPDLLNSATPEVKHLISERAKELSESYGFNIYESSSTIGENVKSANPGYVGGKTDPLRNNCAHSVIAWFYREMGLDVKALPMNSDEIDGGITPGEFRRYFKGLKLANPPISIPKGTVDECKRQLADSIKKNGGGEDGAIGMWRAKGPNGGHFMGWKNVNGDIVFVNPQNGQDNCDKWFAYMSAGKLEDNIDIDRMDGIPENPKKIKLAIQNSK